MPSGDAGRDGAPRRPEGRLLILATMLAASASLVGGCRTPSEEPPTPSATTAPSPEAPVFAGPLTPERIRGAKNLVRLRDPWAAAWRRLLGHLGTPTRSQGDEHHWAVVADGHCWDVAVQRSGDIVGLLVHPSSVPARGARKPYARCVAATRATSNP